MQSSLYRKYRPQNLDQIIGQDVAVTILKNSLLNNKINHAYLFSGQRGIGKTSLARIFAKMLNCEKLVNKTTPCGKCSSCLTITNGTSMIVTEIDAASNNGVDNIRDIQDKLNFSYEENKTVIYIIDEIHMLSKSAFNALLKTIEEPSSNIVFIFATTEIHKVPDTIASRCQKIELRNVNVDVIQNHLIDIANKEKITFEKEAIAIFAKLAQGSIRDAISLFEVAIAYSAITVENVCLVLSIPNLSSIENFIKFYKAEDFDNLQTLINAWKKQELNLTKTLHLLIDSIVSKISIDQSNRRLLRLLSEIYLILESSFNDQLRFNMLYNTMGQSSAPRKTIEIQLPIKEQPTPSEPTSAPKTIPKPVIANDPIMEETAEIIISKHTIRDNVLNILFQSDEQIKVIKDQWKGIKSLIGNPQYEFIAKILTASTVIATAPNAILIGFKLKSQLAEFKKIEQVEEFHKLIETIFKNSFNVIAVSSEEWSKFKTEYDEFKLNGKSFRTWKFKPYRKMIEAVKAKEIQSQIDDLFGDLNG